MNVAGASSLCVAVLCLALVSEAARAQVSGSVGVISDYRLRGFSLTDNRAALVVSAAYDHPSGFYAGGSVIGHDPKGEAARILGGQVYAGVAGRLRDDGPTWDVGVNRVDMSLYFDRPYPLEYTEAYVGLSQGGLSGRLSLADDYPNDGAATAYAEVNGVVRPAENWRLTGHLGAQRQVSGPSRNGRRTRYDVTVGVVREFERCEAYLSWIAVSPRPKPPTSMTRPGFVAGLSFFF